MEPRADMGAPRVREILLQEGRGWGGPFIMTEPGMYKHGN